MIPVPPQYIRAFVLISSLFLLWGVANSMLEVLNKHFQEHLHVSIRESNLVQFCGYFAYFIMGLPAGYFMKKFGYKNGILLGLAMYAFGAFLFYPATIAGQFVYFLLAILTMGCGIAVIETAANPYVTVLGDRETGAQRVNIAQIMNGVGIIIGPLMGGLMVFEKGAGLEAVQTPYICIGLAVLAVAVLIYRTPLPEIEEEKSADNSLVGTKKLTDFSFWGAVAAQFFNCGGMVCVWAAFINYCVETEGIDKQAASFMFSASMVLFLSGRFVGTALMSRVAPSRMLFVFALGCVFGCGLVFLNSKGISLVGLFVIQFFMSITFPTIFGMGVKDLGDKTKLGSSYIIMAIIGGALMPQLSGYLADLFHSTAYGFIVPAICYLFVAFYAFAYQKSEKIG